MDEGTDVKDVDGDQVAHRIVNGSNADETLGLSGVNADGARNVAGRAERPQAGLRPPRRRGPTTPAGKARVSGNAVTHAMSSTRLVVAGESAVEAEAYRRMIVDDLAPVGPVETALARTGRS